MLAEHFRVDEVALDDDAMGPSYNVAPRADVLAVREREGARRMGRMRWGLVPSFAEDPSLGDRMINARAESVVEKPAFRRAFERRRCIVPADGFFEWQTLAGGKKHPMYIRARSGAPLALAGLWETWRDADDPGADWLLTCSIITTAANAVVAPVHDRMPVVLATDDWDEWLADMEGEVHELERLLRPAPDDLLELWPVSPRVNSARNDDPSLLEREDPLTLFP